MDCAAELDFSQMKLTSGSSRTPSPTDSCEFKTLRPTIEIHHVTCIILTHFDSLSIGATPGPEQETMSPSTEPLPADGRTDVLVMLMFVSQEIFW